MKKTFFKALVLVLFLLFVHTQALKAQTADGLDEEAVKNPYGGIRATKEVTYVAGKDKLWFTMDDEVFHYYLAEYNANGKMAKKSCYTIGPDRVPFTSDDQLQDYFVYEYDAQGGPTREVHYKVIDGKDAQDYYSLDEHNAAGIKTKVVRYNQKGNVAHYIVYGRGTQGRLTQDVEYKGPGPDGKWFTKDDEIEKYHMRVYDKDGKLIRAMEYHVDYKGPGSDGVWFTEDDVVSSTREFIYGKAPYPTMTLKCTGPGPDGAWFTDDDIMQYYTVRAYTQVINGK